MGTSDQLQAVCAREPVDGSRTPVAQSVKCALTNLHPTAFKILPLVATYSELQQL
jgi:hypothetical protein